MQRTEKTEQAFQALTSSPVLRNPDFNLPIMVHMDASERGLWAVLSQTFDREGHLALYVCRKLTPAEQNSKPSQ